MDNLVQTIEEATAKVDGTSEDDVIVKVSSEPTVIKPAAGEDENNQEKKKNGDTPPTKMVDDDDDNLKKRRLSEDNQDGTSKRSKTEEKDAEAPEKSAEEEVKEEISKVALEDTTPPPVVVEPVATTTAVEEPIVVEEEEKKKKETEEEITIPEAVSSDSTSAPVAPPADPEPQVTSSESVVEPETVAAPVDSSIINLDSTMESESGENATEGNIADDDETLDKTDGAIDESMVVVEEEETPSKAEEPVVAVVVEKPTSSEMEVTLDAKDHLDTPNVSICPMTAASQLLVSAVAPHLMLSNGSSTPNSNNATSVEFQATPIKKSIEESIEELHGEGKGSSVVDSSSHDTLSISDDKTKSSSDDKTNAAMQRLQENLKQVNGLTTSESSLDEKSSAVEGILNLLETLSDPEDLIYDTAVHVDNGTLQYLLIERLDHRVAVAGHPEITSDATSTSNGSATSLGPFVLPAVGRTASGLSVSSSTSASSLKHFVPTAENKKTIKGLGGLKTFLQELLKQLPEEKKKATGRGKGRTAATAVTPSKPTTTTAEKRGSLEAPSSSKAAAIVAATTTVESPTPSNKKTVAFAATGTTSASGSQVENFVMARWSDKKYYAGRVKAEKPGNKFVVHFEDGAQRTLASEHIVFGDKFVAPLLNHQVNVLVEANIYETGLVMGINTEACTYEVTTDTRTVVVPASDLYLDEDQAKEVQNGAAGKKPTAASVESTSSSSASAKESVPAVSPMSRRKRNADTLNSSAEAGPSTVAETATKKSRKRQLVNPPPQISTDTQFSDMSDTFDSEPAQPPKSPEVAFVEAVDGVQPEYELTKGPNETKIQLTCGIYRDDLNDQQLETDQLGPVPSNNSLFRNKHFILTCTVLTKSKSTGANCNGGHREKFTDRPFIMGHLVKQLRSGGGTVYEHFEDIPKTKYKSCVLITHEPCLTARYIQCMAVNMLRITHDWVIESCLQNRLLDFKSYILPTGWSLLEGQYVRWQPARTNVYPLINRIMLISSENEDFLKFWTRVCKSAGAKVRPVKSVLDISANKKSFLLTDSELLVVNVEKAKAVDMPIVSTNWITECLILGKLVAHDSHENFTKINWDFSYS